MKDEPRTQVRSPKQPTFRVCLSFHEMQGGQAVKPPRSSSSLPSASSCLRCLAEAGADRKRSLGGGKDSDAASNVAVVQSHHTCDRASPQQLVRDGPVSLTPQGAGAKCSIGMQQKRGTTSGELGQELVMGDLATPLTSAGAGDVGAEHDATPLQSRPSRGGSFTLASVPGGDAGGGGTEAASKEIPPSGMEESSSTGEGRGGLKRKDTITWESFLANITVVDGTKGADGGAKGAAVGSASDSSSPVEVQLPREASSEGPTAEVSLCMNFLARFMFVFFSFCRSFGLIPSHAPRTTRRYHTTAVRLLRVCAWELNASVDSFLRDSRFRTRDHTKRLTVSGDGPRGLLEVFCPQIKFMDTYPSFSRNPPALP